jgi:hypothetical protein
MPVLPGVLSSRESFPEPGNIAVTPIPLDPPIRSRPILTSSHSHYKATYTFPHAGAEPPSADGVRWPLVILFILLAMLLGTVLSKWGWMKITGKIWQWASRWEGSLEDDIEEEELLEQPTSNKATEMEVVDINEIYAQPDDVEWISRRESR